MSLSIFGFESKQPSRETIEWICANTSDENLMRVARFYLLRKGFPYFRAARHFEHYLGGSGEDIKVNLRALLDEDPGFRYHVCREIRFSFESLSKLEGTMGIRQSVYANEDWQLALGAIDLNWKIQDSRGTAAFIWFTNAYAWHPDDTGRPTHCIHQRAEAMRWHREKGLPLARNFDMYGEAILELPTREEILHQDHVNIYMEGDKRE